MNQTDLFTMGLASVFSAVCWNGRFGVCLVLLASMLGCAKKPEPDQQVLRISQRNEPSDLDPATASLPDEFFIIRALGEGLLVPNPEGGEPLAGAAELFDVSSDGLTYTFHLRRDARWSDGEPVTAQDFVAAFERVLTPATAAPKAHLFHSVRNARAFATGALTDFSRVGFRAQGRHTHVISLTAPNPKFPLYVASGPWIPSNLRAVTSHGRRWTAPENHIGNGPFVLVEWRPQQRVVVRKNPRYHAAQTIHLAEIRFVRVDNQEAEDRAYRAGQVEVTMSVPQSRLDVYARERPAELQRTSLAETRFISFNTRRGPLRDARVRRALAMAIDREKITTFVLKGGQLPATRFLSPALLESTTGAGDNLPSPHFFAPEEARRLLAEAGFPAGHGFPSLELAGWAQNPVLEAIQQMWRQELGIEIRLRVQEAKVHLAALQAGSYDLAFVTNLLDVRDPALALNDFTSGAPNNFPHWESPEFDSLIHNAMSRADLRAARKAVFSAEHMLLTDAAVTPVYFNTQNWLKSTRVQGWQQDALWSRRYNDVRLRGK